MKSTGVIVSSSENMGKFIIVGGTVVVCLILAIKILKMIARTIVREIKKIFIRRDRHIIEEEIIKSAEYLNRIQHCSDEKDKNKGKNPTEFLNQIQNCSVENYKPISVIIHNGSDEKDKDMSKQST